ncbi:MAG: GNAT family N-acetyltransferase [Sulfitobacter sp.]
MEMSKVTVQPLIETERFDLRPLRKSDIGLCELYASDARIARMTSSIPHPLPPGTTDAFVKRAMSDPRTEDVWAVDGSKTGGSELMGVISLERLTHNHSEIGYWVAPAFWNSGLASDAVAALITANPLENCAMFGTVFQDNPASARVLTHCGFEYLGDAEVFSVARNATVATWTYSRKLGHKG